MGWIWEIKDWPNFQYDSDIIAQQEKCFLQKAGHLSGLASVLPANETQSQLVELLSDEATTSSAIEGEYLNRESVRSSIRRQLGLGKERQKSSPSEEGIAEMMIDVYQHFNQPLDDETLCRWNFLITRNRPDLKIPGDYRAHDDTMQIVSGPIGGDRIHYEAPPSSRVAAEMAAFIQWMRNSRTTLPAIIRAAIAHLYLVCIHPFEDGNGRIARAIAVRSLSQSLNEPFMLLLSSSIQAQRKHYYQALASTNHSLNINKWLTYFADTLLDALDVTEQSVRFSLHKAQFFDRFSAQLNDRQIKVMKRIFKEGIKGFEGGLSAHNYIKIADTSPATATRDLNELVELKILTKTGERKSTRYYWRPL